MDPNTQFQTSFIPKKPMAQQVESVIVHHKRPMGALSFFAIFIIIVLVIATIGLYLYKNVLNGELASAKQSLILAQKSFGPEVISDLELFNRRMSASKVLLSSHVVFSPLFSLLNQLTIPSVQFTRFQQTSTATGEGFTVRLNGIARDYKSIALQAQVFNSPSGKYLQDVVFSNLTLSNEDTDKKGYVTFSLSFTVDPVLLSYEKQLASYEKKDPIVPLLDSSFGNADEESTVNTDVVVPEKTKSNLKKDVPLSDNEENASDTVVPEEEN